MLSSIRFLSENFQIEWGEIRRGMVPRHRIELRTYGFITLQLSLPPIWVFVRWTFSSSCQPRGWVRCHPSSLYTFTFRCLARDCHFTGFPEFERFSSCCFRQAMQLPSQNHCSTTELARHIFENLLYVSGLNHNHLVNFLIHLGWFLSVFFTPHFRKFCCLIWC